MTARIWHVVPADRTPAHGRFMQARAISKYCSIQGKPSAQILERSAGELGHFVTFTLWDVVEVIRALAGPDETPAQYHPEDQDYLLAFDERVSHFPAIGKPH
jgi:hypothetical protein